MASIVGAAIAFALAGAGASIATKYNEKPNNERDKYQKARDEEYDAYKAARDAYDKDLREYQDQQMKRHNDVNSADAVFIGNEKLLNKYNDKFMLNNIPPRLSDYISTPPQKTSSNVWTPLIIGVSATVVGGMVLFSLSKKEKR